MQRPPFAEAVKSGGVRLRGGAGAAEPQPSGSLRVAVERAVTPATGGLSLSPRPWALESLFSTKPPTPIPSWAWPECAKSHTHTRVPRSLWLWACAPQNGKPSSARLLATQSNPALEDLRQKHVPQTRGRTWSFRTISRQHWGLSIMILMIIFTVL